MKTKLILLNVIIALIFFSCNSERAEYFNTLTKDAEIVVNYTDHKGKKIEILWAIIDGKVDYFTTNSKQFTRSYTGSFDCRLSKLEKAGPYSMEFESPKNKPAFGGDDYYYEVEIKFDLPKDLNQKEHFVNGTIYITGHNAAGDGGNTSDTYDASFEIYNYAVDKTITKREAATTNPDDVISEMKNILDKEASDVKEQEKLVDGNYCFQLDDLKNSGDFYYCTMTVENDNIKGEIIVENESSESYTMKFNGSTLSVNVTYSNDGGGPNKEQWKINSNGLTLEQPAVILTKIKCDD